AAGRPHDRRECPRVPFSFLCRCAVASEPYEESRGDLSTGGVFWGTTHAAHCKEVEVRIAIPGEREEIHARGGIVGHRAAGCRVRVTALATDDGLRLARCLDEGGAGWQEGVARTALEAT